MRMADLRMAMMFSPIHSYLYSQPISPAQILGLEGMDAGEPAPGSSEETKLFLTAMGAVKKDS